jgi:signal transduction histidine kinase
MGSAVELVLQLRATLGRLELALAVLPDAMVWVNAKGQVQWCNVAFDNLVGREHTEILAQPLYDLLPLRHGGQRLGPGEVPWTGTLPGDDHPTACYEVLSHGQTRWVEISTVSQGAPAIERTSVCILRDVSERFWAEEMRRELNAQLVAANRELESFAYSASHDLRAPLRSIDGFSQALLEEYEDRLDDTGRDYLGRVRAAAQRMGALIDDLLRLSRVSRVELKYEAVDLSALATRTAAELRAADPHRRAEFRIRAGCVAHGDPQLLAVLMDNLLGNAWKFTSTRENAQIELGAILRGGEEHFFVRDNGVGFDMAYASKLFTPFSRLHRADEFPGTGIGLATVQRVVNRHGGHISGEGTPNKGATFYLTLPAKSTTGGPP